MDWMPSSRRRSPEATRTLSLSLCCRLPAPDTAHVDVDELFTRVIADAAAMQREGSISELGGCDPGDPYINRHRLHVEAVKRHVVPVRVQHFIGPRRAITADHIDLTIWPAERSEQIMQEIEDPRVIGVNLAGAAVAQIVVQLGEPYLVVPFAIPIHDVETPARVGIQKMQSEWT